MKSKTDTTRRYLLPFFLGLVLFLSLCLAATGCGGNGQKDSNTPKGWRGDGDIPIGRAVPEPVKDAQGYASATVTITATDGTTVSGYVSSNGTIVMPYVPDASGTLVVTPLDSTLQPATAPILFGPDYRYVINVQLTPTLPSDVTGIAFATTPPTTVSVGSTTQISVQVLGANSENLAATIWIDGGVGALSTNNVFTASTAGTGTIRAKLGSYEIDAPITVTP